jgi:hypothetical protein
MVAFLAQIAARELGLGPMMSVEDDGIYITREADDDGLLLTYSFKPRHCTPELLEGLAEHILKQSLVDDTFLINKGFKREYWCRSFSYSVLYAK